MLAYWNELISIIGTGSPDWALFASTFTLIFVAELPDKTALAALLLATTHNPFAVFMGAAGAFVIQSVVAVAFGSLFSLLPHQLVQVVAGLLFLLFAFLMWRRQADGEEKGLVESGNPRFLKSVSASFLVIFIAEWGDLTQLATATLAAKSKAPLTIFTAATLSLWLVSAIGIFIGYKLKRTIDPEKVKKLAAVAMAAVGIYLLVSLLF